MEEAVVVCFWLFCFRVRETHAKGAGTRTRDNIHKSGAGTEATGSPQLMWRRPKTLTHAGVSQAGRSNSGRQHAHNRKKMHAKAACTPNRQECRGHENTNNK